MIAVLRRLYKSQQAATLIEYSLIVCLIAGVAIGAMTFMGQKVLNMLGPMGNALG
jgi:Flp pilus assembly pilin Flp